MRRRRQPRIAHGIVAPQPSLSCASTARAARLGCCRCGQIASRSAAAVAATARSAGEADVGTADVTCHVIHHHLRWIGSQVTMRLTATSIAATSTSSTGNAAAADGDAGCAEQSEVEVSGVPRLPRRRLPTLPDERGTAMH